MDYLIEMRGITKKFPGVVANDGITFQLKKGEIHALLGENGAGKSTLMSVLFGLYKPDAGEILLNGARVKIGNPNDATKLGIGMVHQHFKLVQNFTVLENIIMGVEDVKLGFLEMKTARKKVVEISRRYGLSIDPDAYVADVTVGMQQRVEILKMLYRENEVLIFDEPTAVLTPQEIEELIKTMRGLVAEGKSILFITHKLNEIKAAADRCTVLRKGKCVGTVDVGSSTPEQLSEMMVGRKVSLNVEKCDPKPGKIIFEVKNLSAKDHSTGKKIVDGINFSVREGEIVCVAGIEGNGQSELVQILTGLREADGGAIFINGSDATKSPIRRRGLDGMAHIPEDRHKHGLVLDYSLAQNLVLQNYFESRFQKRGFIKERAVEERAKFLIGAYDIRSGRGPSTTMRSMSGGNQQKAIVARELERGPLLIVAVQPTRGLDVGAIEYIHSQLIKARDEGKGILIVSLELDEVMNLSDRILVIYEGRIVAEADPKTVTYRELGLYMSGSKSENVAEGAAGA